MRIMPPAPRAAKPAGASHALLEELLEAGETDLSDTAELTAEVELAGEAELMDAVDLVDTADFADRGEPANAELPRGGIDLKDHLSAIEIGLIRKALVEADGTVAEAARLLRMRRTTLVEKLRKYRLSA
jgi:sigma-54 specific flagellar transcriptional regulator A